MSDAREIIKPAPSSPSSHPRGARPMPMANEPDTFINAMDMMTERDEWRTRALAAGAVLRRIADEDHGTVTAPALARAFLVADAALSQESP